MAIKNLWTKRPCTRINDKVPAPTLVSLFVEWMSDGVCQQENCRITIANIFSDAKKKLQPTWANGSQAHNSEETVTWSCLSRETRPEAFMEHCHPMHTALARLATAMRHMAIERKRA